MIEKYAKGIIRVGGVSREEAEKQFKKDYCENILMDLDDDFVRAFYDRESDEKLELKVRVLEALADGKKPEELGEDYKAILERLPKRGIDATWN